MDALVLPVALLGLPHDVYGAGVGHGLQEAGVVLLAQEPGQPAQLRDGVLRGERGVCVSGNGRLWGSAWGARPLYQ